MPRYTYCAKHEMQVLADESYGPLGRCKSCYVKANLDMGYCEACFNYTANKNQKGATNEQKN